MKTAAIISEFNPFHNGHKFLIDECEKSGFTHKVAIMSGSFVQRGDLALFSKFERTKSALKNGIDLVVELPVCYALSTAQNFAFGGVQIAEKLAINNLVFGSECGNTESILQTAKNLMCDELNSKIKQELNGGLTYAKARQVAFQKLFGESEILSNPNDILGIEYISQIIINNYNISPIAFKRQGVQHDSNTINAEFASASYIREEINKGNIDSIKGLVPESEYMCYVNLVANKEYSSIKNLEKAILIKLKSMTAEDLRNITDVNEGLENKILSAVNNSVTLNDLYENIKSKRYTLSRIKRIVLSAFLNIDSSYFKTNVPYIRVLGFNEKGLEIIKNANCDIPIILRASELKDNKLFKLEMNATDCFNMALFSPKKAKQDLIEKLIKF